MGYCIFFGEFEGKYYICNVIQIITIMTEEERKARMERMARNYAINSKKTPKTKRMAYAREHSGEVIITDPELIERLKYYLPDYDPAVA